MPNGITTQKPLKQFLGDLLIKHKGRTSDKDMAKEVKAEFPKLKKDLLGLAALIKRVRRSLNKGKLKYKTRVVTIGEFAAPEPAITEFGAKPAKPSAEKAKTKPVMKKPKLVIKKPAASA